MSVENGSDKVGAKKVLTEWNEAAAVALALESMPPLKTVGEVWREYRDGTWRETDYHRHRPGVLETMADSIKSNRHCLDVLKHIEGLKQVLESDFKSFYTLDGDAVLVNASNGIVRVEPDYILHLLPHDPAHNFTRQLSAVYTTARELPYFRACPNGSVAGW